MQVSSSPESPSSVGLQHQLNRLFGEADELLLTEGHSSSIVEFERASQVTSAHLDSIESLLNSSSFTSTDTSLNASLKELQSTYRSLLEEYRDIRHKARFVHMSRLKQSKLSHRSFPGSNTSSSSQQRESSLASLTRSHKVLSESLAGSGDSLAHLVASTNQLNASNKELMDYRSRLRTASSLLAKHANRATTDKIIILISLLLFFSVVLYILNKRMRISILLGNLSSLINQLFPTLSPFS